MKLHGLFESTYRFSQADVRRLWCEINYTCFNGELTEPPIYIEQDLNHLVQKQYTDKFGGGDALGYCDEDPETKEIVLLLGTKIESARELMEVLAYEMVHQALAEKHGYIGMLKVGHDAEFMSYAQAIKKYYNLKLLGASY
jgi:hypothetical protein